MVEDLANGDEVGIRVLSTIAEAFSYPQGLTFIFKMAESLAKGDKK